MVCVSGLSMYLVTPSRERCRDSKMQLCRGTPLSISLFNTPRRMLREVRPFAKEPILLEMKVLDTSGNISGRFRGGVVGGPRAKMLLYAGWISTKLMPADAPSRGERMRDIPFQLEEIMISRWPCVFATDF